MKSTPQEELLEGVKRVEHLGLEESEEARRKRGVRALNRETSAKIRRAFYWFLFGVSCAVVLIILAGLGTLTVVWILSFVDDAVKLEAFLKDVGAGLLIILATITVERIFTKPDD